LRTGTTRIPKRSSGFVALVFDEWLVLRRGNDPSLLPTPSA
jgi:hypothetical protein